MFSEAHGRPPITRSATMDRRQFLKLGGAGLAGVLLLGNFGAGKALAQADPSLMAEFRSAANKYGVPIELLLALGYVNTRWEMPDPDASAYEKGDLHGWGGYGIMALRQNPAEDTLGEAARLTGISEDKLKTDRRSNIMGGAALLAEKIGNNRPANAGINAWFDPVVGLGGESNDYANQVYETLQLGANWTTLEGQRLTLPKQEQAETRQTYTAQATAEDFPRMTVWRPAHYSNYTRSNRPRSNPIRKIIIHVTQGSWSSAINWFQNPSADVSAHYVVRSRDGKIAQCVRNKDIAWHAGNWNYNVRSIGIEHEGYVGNRKWFTDVMYRRSAKLSALICKRYKIPVRRKRIIGHNQVPGASHTDPGRYWNWRKYMRLVRRYRRRLK